MRTLGAWTQIVQPIITQACVVKRTTWQIARAHCVWRSKRKLLRSRGKGEDMAWYSPSCPRPCKTPLPSLKTNRLSKTLQRMAWITKKEETRGHYTAKMPWHHPYILYSALHNYRDWIFSDFLHFGPLLGHTICCAHEKHTKMISNLFWSKWSN